MYNTDPSYGNKKKGDLTSWGYDQKNPALTPTPKYTFDDKKQVGGNQSDNTNKLDRSSRSGEDRTIDNRVEIVPEHPVGNLQITYDQFKDANGNPVVSDIEVGTVDPQGNETPLSNQNFNADGSISVDFSLKEGEILYFRESVPKGAVTGGNLVLHATKTPTPQQNQQNQQKSFKLWWYSRSTTKQQSTE